MAATKYIALADLQLIRSDEELVQLTDYAENTGEIVEAVTDDAIEWASAQIDSYASKLYTLSLTANSTVKGLCKTLTVYRLEADRNQLREDTEKEFDRAMAFLKDVAAGKASLSTEDTPQVVTTAGAKGPDRNELTGTPDEFSRSRVKDY